MMQKEDQHFTQLVKIPLWLQRYLEGLPKRIEQLEKTTAQRCPRCPMCGQVVKEKKGKND
jgi:hypothetical protein